MPLFSSKLELTTAAKNAGTALADISYLKGSFYTVADLTALNAIPVTRCSDKQVVWVEGESKTYQATVTLADYVSTFTDSVAWSQFTGFGSAGGGGSSTVGNLSDVTTGSLANGQVLQWNSSTNKWEASNVSGTGDISAVFAGDGLTGGGTAGSVSLDISAGSAINLAGGTVNVNTSSAHFITAVQNLDVFNATGSVWNTTRTIGITGSLTLRQDSTEDGLSIYSGSVKTFGITGDGLLRLVTQSVTPSATAGTLYLDSDYNLFIGQE
ncbi:MAG: hypothetical protein ACKVJK_10690 [Methylophagaceae bacterium]|jgi:hypothetical protein|tara:strand:+ start:849 stop:1652 length:804 start_codon:yes stop_codon:yes gene_type:complete